MLANTWILLKDTANSFIDDEALTRGAAMAFYAAVSLAPLLLIVIAIAGLVFGQDAARNAVSGQFESLMGHQSAAFLQDAIKNAGQKSSGILATAIGIATLVATASGVFGELQTALNKIWHVTPEGTTVSRLIRARAVSLGLVATLGFLLLASLAISAAITGLGDYLDAHLAFGKLVVSAINAVISFALIAMMFAAIYKILPDKDLEWRDVIIGACATSLLFAIGKSLIGWYLGSSTVASTYGAAAGLMLVLLWIYYSVQIFLLGAEFTHAYANHHGSQPRKPTPKRPPSSPNSTQSFTSSRLSTSRTPIITTPANRQKIYSVQFCTTNRAIHRTPRRNSVRRTGRNRRQARVAEVEQQADLQPPAHCR